MFETRGHILNLNKFVPVVLVEDAASANCVTARFAEVFDLLVDVARAASELARLEWEASLGSCEG